MGSEVNVDLSQYERFIGVDPGSPLFMACVSRKGELLAVTDRNHVALGKGTGTQMENNASLIAAIIRKWTRGRIGIVVIENATARPGQGLVSTSKYIGSAYMIMGIAAAFNLPYHVVTPAKWKADLQLSKSDKEASRKAALALWPNKSGLFKRKGDHNKAEAALIGLWGSRRLL